MQSVLVIVGTRAEAIKLAPVLKAMRGELDTIVLTSGEQHALVEQALAGFEVIPHIVLDPKRPDLPPNTLLSGLIAEIDGVLQTNPPDWVLVQGDSISALAAGLAAFGRGLRLAHVEAGLRSGDLADPYPEEGNRLLLSRLATLHFAPTRVARQNLVHEGIRPEAIIVTGNTIVDAIALARQGMTRERRNRIDRSLPLDTRPVVLITCHRRESRGEIFIDLCLAFQQLCESWPDHHWLFPLFPDPEIHEIASRMLGHLPNLTLMGPLSYPELLHVLDRAVLVVTDSAGLQEEAPSFGVPAIIIREHTERPESIGAGAAKLAGRSAFAMLAAAAEWLDHPERKQALARRNPYGDGGASHRIVTALLRHDRPT